MSRSTILHGEPDRALASFMSGRGYRIFLPEGNAVTSNDNPFSGRFTVRWYAEKYGINAIQIEISSSFRTRDAEFKGKKLSSDLAEFFSKLPVRFTWPSPSSIDSDDREFAETFDKYVER